MSANLKIHIGMNPFFNISYNNAQLAASNHESIWVGEAAFLKAILYKDEQKYIPQLVGFILTKIPNNNSTLLTLELIADILNFSGENITTFKVATPELIASSLSKHIGEFSYSASW